MGLFSAEAVLLDVVNLHEADQIVTFLTAENGKKRGVVRGARRKHSRFAGQLQLLSRVRVDWFESGRSDLGRISGIELLRPAAALQGDLEGILLSCYLADQLNEFVQDNEDSRLPYRLINSTVDELLAGGDRNLAARYFEVWLLRLSGIFPQLDACSECGEPYDARGAVLPRGYETLVCQRCGSRGLEIPAEVLEALLTIRTSSLVDLRSAGFSKAVLDKVERLCAGIRRYFLQSELKSYKVMRETLAGA